VRSYVDPGAEQWSSFAVSRITKRIPGLNFINPIHEMFSRSLEPRLHLKTFAHHWGYAFETEEQLKEKTARNLVPLQKELKKNPNDLRVCLLIFNELSGDEKFEFLDETLKKVRKQLNNPYSAALLTINVIRSYKDKEYELTLTHADEFFKLYNNIAKNTLFIDVHAAKALALKELERYEEAIEAFKQYFVLYEAYMTGTLDTTGMGIIPINYCEPEHYASARAVYSELLSLTGRMKLTLGSENTSEMKVQVVSKGEPEEKEEEALVTEQSYREVLEALKNAVAAPDINTLELYGAALIFAGRYPWHEREAFYKSFAKLSALYTSENYGADIKPEKLSELPEVCRFGYLAGKKEFAKALESCESEHLKYALEYLSEEA